jgi:hypothetical protein
MTTDIALDPLDSALAADPRQRDADLARRFGLSREAVRLRRQKLGLPARLVIIDGDLIDRLDGVRGPDITALARRVGLSSAALRRAIARNPVVAEAVNRALVTVDKSVTTCNRCGRIVARDELAWLRKGKRAGHCRDCEARRHREMYARKMAEAG